MKCFHAVQGRDTNGYPSQFRCGQCTACRVLRQSGWMLRNLMEYRSSMSGQLLTLTIDPEHATPDFDGPKSIKGFFHALRQRDRRAFGTSPVRYFGCSEYGGTFGRLHFHFLIYNAGTHFTLERGVVSTPIWPYGFAHLGSFQKASVRYVTAYLMENDWTGEKPKPYMSLKPGIGFSSLRQLGASLATKLPMISEVPSAMILGQRTYPLDRTARGYLLSGYLQAGGDFSTPSAEELIRRRTERITLDALTTEQERHRQIRMVLEQEQRLERANNEKAAQFAQIFRQAAVAAAEKAGEAPDTFGPVVEIDNCLRDFPPSPKNWVPPHLDHAINSIPF